MTSTHHSISTRKKGRPKTKGLRETPNDSLEFFEDDTDSFFDDELLTLDEFESLQKELKTPKSDPNGDAKKRQRIDPPINNVPTVTKRRAKVARRRQIDPSTCERDYTTDEVEFMNALNEYKRSSGRMFPTCSEILEVLKNLGYEKAINAETDPTA